MSVVSVLVIANYPGVRDAGQPERYDEGLVGGFIREAVSRGLVLKTAGTYVRKVY